MKTKIKKISNRLVVGIRRAFKSNLQDWNPPKLQLIHRFCPILALITLMASPELCSAQTNLPAQPDLIQTNGWSEVGRGILDIGKGIYSAMPTNNDVAIYGTYVFKPKKFGFGALDAYNISNGIGIVGGVDYIDTFVGVNGGIQIKRTFVWHGFDATLFGISALLTPLKGGGDANGGLGTANSLGVDLRLYVKLHAGGLYGTRTGAGSYGGGYANAYFSLSF